jgi:predicted transcriptional regulator
MRKAAPPREIPPPLELECLKVLWSLGEGRVHDVRTSLGPARELKYTTVMTVLERLAKRGAASRRKVVWSFVYRPLLAVDALQALALREFVDRYFGGSLRELENYLTGNRAG